MSSRPIRVLIVDDSSLVRQTMTDILQSDPDIEVMATASDPFVAAERIKNEIPDVMILDVEMPRMDGVTFLRKLMSQCPLPVIMCSTLTEANSDLSLRALEYGAVEIIEKPKLGTKRFLEESRIRICDAVKAAARAKIGKPLAHMEVAPKLSADVIVAAPSKRPTFETTDKVVAVGASTGGTEALRVFLESFPVDCPGIVIVQHMPERFTRSFAERLDSICAIRVKEAVHGDTVLRGQALIAQGDKHMLLQRSGARYHVELREGPLVKRHRPSVDVLFRTAARSAGPNAVGVIMTGMGDDGAAGLKEMRDSGSHTLAQDEATCVVYGMPGEAVKLGAAERILALQALGPAVMTWAKSSKTWV